MMKLEDVADNSCGDDFRCQYEVLVSKVEGCIVTSCFICKTKACTSRGSYPALCDRSTAACKSLDAYLQPR